jgi:hypothetical protein
VIEEADIRADEKPQMSRRLKFVFPLAVVVLLVYLASQTVLPDNGDETDLDYSQFLDFVDSSPGSVGKVTSRSR